MFEVNGVYENRKGKYTVLAVKPPKMTVRYEDGIEAELNMNIQARIWENIVAEQEARAASRSARAARLGLAVSITQHFIKMISIPTTDELTFPGWPEHVVMVNGENQKEKIKAGDRLIFYALEAQAFFAVATIVGEMFQANPKEYFFNNDRESANFFSIDIDAEASSLEKAIAVESVELESYPNFKMLRKESEAFLKISEDDFELLAELLTEVSEEEEELIEEDEDYEEEEDE